MSRRDWHVSDESGRALVALAADDPVDPSLLADPEMDRLIYRHGLAVPAARLLAHTGSRGERLGAVAARLHARQERIDLHLQAILERMADQGVRAGVVKGPAIAGRYRDRTIRTYTDVDVVVPRSELPGALEVLSAYEHTNSVPLKRPAADKRDVVIRDPSGMDFSVDLHWSLFSFRQLGGRADGAMDEAWDRAQYEPESPLGPSWRLPDEAVISFLSLHSVLDHRFRLILFRDLLEIAQDRPDWDRLVDFARRHGLLSFNRVAWTITEQILGGEVAETLSMGSGETTQIERLVASLLRRADIVRFDGHRVHPLNLAITLLHDDRAQRLRLIRRAPAAFPGWRRKVRSGSGSNAQALTVLVTSNARRGAEVFGGVLAEQLAHRGWETALVSLHGETGGGIPSQVLSDTTTLKGIQPRVVLALRRLLKRNRSSIVFANGGATLRYAIAAGFLMRRGPRIVYGSIGEPSFWLRGRLHRGMQRMLVAACSHVTAVSEATAADLRDLLEVPPSKVSVIHPGVSDEWFSVARPERHGRPLRVLYVGSLSFEKDPLTAVAAVETMKDEALIRVLGDGPLRSEIELRASSGVEILGSVADIASHMEWADVLVLTSLTEGLPGVAVEAAATGLPVVASDVGGITEVVVDGETGLLAPPKDVVGFANALSRLAGDPELRSKMGEMGRELVRESFRLAPSVDAYEKVFRDMRN